MQFIQFMLSKLLARKGQLIAVGKVLSVSVLNQVVSSGTNFVLGVYLVRVLTPAEFGLYGIGFSIALLYSGVGNALFLTQMVVHVPDKAPEDRLPYAARLLVTLSSFCWRTIVAAGVVVFSSISAGLLSQSIDIVIAITATSVFYLLKDFFVRHAYTVRKESWALFVNMAIAFVLFLLCLVQHYFFSGISNSLSALWIYAVSNFAGVVIGLILVRLPILSVRMQQLFDDAKEAWVGGKWALGGVFVVWLQTQAYMYVTAIFMGPIGVGYANAAKLFITPALFLIPAIIQVVMPILAEMRVTNMKKVLKISNIFTVGLVFFGIIYSVLLLAFIKEITMIIIGVSNHEEIMPLVVSWCFVLIFQLSRTSSSVLLQVTKQFRTITLVNSVSAFITIIATVIMMQLIAVQGAIIGMALGELVLSYFLFTAVIKLECSKVN